MALKQKITKEDHAKLPADIQKEYKASGDEFVLDLEGYEDPAELRRARDREKAARAEAETRERDAKKAADTAQAELDRLSGMTEEERRKALRKDKDIDQLEASWRTEKEKAVNTEKEGKDKLAAKLRKRLENDAAASLAKQLAGDAADLLLPHILPRVRADIDADEPTTRVLDATGQVSALSVADLANEFRTNPKFAAIIIGSNGSGGGAPGGRQGSNGGAAKKFADMNSAERGALLKSDPARFHRESEAAQRTGPVI